MTGALNQWGGDKDFGLGVFKTHLGGKIVGLSDCLKLLLTLIFLKGNNFI